MTFDRYNIDEMLAGIEKFASLQREYNEQILAEIITKYDFSQQCIYYDKPYSISDHFNYFK